MTVFLLSSMLAWYVPLVGEPLLMFLIIPLPPLVENDCGARANARLLGGFFRSGIGFNFKPTIRSV